MKLYLVTFLRHSINHPKYFLLNLFCLALGIGCSFFIYLFVYKELNTDNFHTKQKNIYKIFSVQKDGTYVSTLTSPPMGPYMGDHLPEVTLYTRVIHSEHRPFTYHIENRQFHNIPLTQVDSSFFKIFNFDLQVGSLDDFKRKPNGVFILPEIAEKFFGNENPIGKSFSAEIPDRPDDKYEFEVIGILKAYPEESTIRPQIIGNIQLELDKPDNMYWGNMMCDLYFLAPFTNNISLTEQIKKVPAKKVGNSHYSYEFDFKEYEAKPLKDVYFYSANIPGNTNYGDQQLISVLTTIGIALLLLVVFNYIILNLGIITSRSQEIKTRRTLGASKRSVLFQFLLNAMVQVLLAFGLILLLYPLIIDALATLERYQYSLIPKTDWRLILWYTFVLMLLSLLTGSIVYLVSNRIIPRINLAENIKIRRNRIYQTLIQFQLVITIIAIISIIFMNLQINLLKNAELGFNMDNIKIVNMLRNDPIRQELSNLSFVENLAHGPGPFSNTPRLDTVLLADGTKVVSQEIHSDHNFLETYGIDLVVGSNLNPDLTLATAEEWRKWNCCGYSGEIIEVLVNQKFIDVAGLDDPVGTLITDGYSFRNARIVGVMKDFQSFPFYHKNSPIVVGNRFFGWSNQLGIKVTPGTKPRLDEFLKAHYAENGLDHLFSQLVWSYDFQEIYQREITLQKLIKTFTIIILLISCLGLFALNLFISTSKTKEIGIRKVNGAKISEILTLLNKDFVKWVVIAFVIATPIGWYAMDQWLQNFAYKTELSWWVFALAGLLALGVALLTVSFQSWKAATKNPVESLRYE